MFATQRKWKAYDHLKKTNYTWIFTAAIFVIAPTGNNLHIRHSVNRQTNHGISIQQNTTLPRKGLVYWYMRHHEWSAEKHTNWKKPNKKSMCCVISLTQNSRKCKSIRSDNKQFSGCTGRLKMRNREELL